MPNIPSADSLFDDVGRKRRELREGVPATAMPTLIPDFAPDERHGDENDEEKVGEDVLIVVAALVVDILIGVGVAVVRLDVVVELLW